MTAEDEGERVRGALLGLAVGDALGAPLEGKSARAAAAHVARGLEMTGGGRWGPGQWTDDTAMALALAESIGRCGLLDTDDLARRYIAWATDGGEGIGRATYLALVHARDAEQARVRAREHFEAGGLAAGNGTVMRVPPIGLAARDLSEALDAARRDAVLTHADPAAAAASRALCATLLALRTGGDPLAAACQQAGGYAQIERALRAVADCNEAVLARLASGPHAGACWTALAIGLYALLSADNYERGVGWAIARGRDTDTNAAVAGALLGYRHGRHAIPSRWLARLSERERIERAADGLLHPGSAS